MSQENVDRVREAFAAFKRGDLETAVSVFHPEAEWYPYLGAREGDLYRGRDSLLKMWSDIKESFGGSFRIEPQEAIDCGEQVVLVVEARGTGSGSGAEVRQSWAQLATMQDGLVLRVEPFSDRDAALEAAGRLGLP
jgi:ketosteroid isomerase-like protein